MENLESARDTLMLVEMYLTQYQESQPYGSSKEQDAGSARARLLNCYLAVEGLIRLEIRQPTEGD